MKRTGSRAGIRASDSKTFTVGSVARIAKVTVRTLHHYDEIGLLRPSGRSQAGYRIYTDSDIQRLQQIRLYRELGVALEAIRGILDAKNFDARKALEKHREHLNERLAETEALIGTIDRMLAHLKGRESQIMTAEDMFEGFEHEEHEAEAKERWGNSPAWKESQRRVATYGKEDWRTIKAEGDSIVEDLARLRADGEPADSVAAIAAAESHRLHIDRWFYACSSEVHAALAELYVNDPRFAGYFDKHGEGLASYVADAIRANAART